MSDLEKYNATNYMEINKSYTNGDGEDWNKRLQEMCPIMSAESDRYSEIWNNLKNITLLGT